MHMAGCTCGDPLQLIDDNSLCMRRYVKIMTCIMENGRLQNDLSAEFIVAHAEFIIASQNGK